MKEHLASETFAIGEIAELCNLKLQPHLNGEEVTVIGPLEMQFAIGMVTREEGEVPCYRVMWRGEAKKVMPHNLRKRPPPREDRKLVRWSECPWQPERIHG